MITHEHKILHWPKTTDGMGYAVCDCGATIRIERGQIPKWEKWHTCKNCTPFFYKDGKLIHPLVWFGDNNLDK